MPENEFGREEAVGFTVFTIQASEFPATLSASVCLCGMGGVSSFALPWCWCSVSHCYCQSCSIPLCKMLETGYNKNA